MEKTNENDVTVSTRSTPGSDTAVDAEAERRLVRKIDWRLMPATAVLYLLFFIDRTNIGNARILNADTHDDLLSGAGMTSYDYTVALMVFLVAYSVFDAPSNVMLKLASPPRWLGLLTVAFGALSAAVGACHTATGVIVLRFFLGVADAGIFPGLVYYYSFWYRPDEVARRIATCLCSATLAGAFGGCIAYGVGHMNGVGGLQGWRWLFVLEGAPAVVVGTALFLWLPSYPDHARWLTVDEKALEADRLGPRANAGAQKIRWSDAKTALQDGRMWLHLFLGACVGCSTSSVSLFSPTIVQGLGFQGLRAQLFTVPPYAAAFCFTMLVSWASDVSRQRGLAILGCNVLAAVAYTALAALPGAQFETRYGLLCVATAGVFGSLPILSAWISDNSMTTTATAIATGLNIAVAGPGQIAGVWIYRTQDAPTFVLGHAVNAGFLAASIMTCLGLMWYYRVHNARRAQAGLALWST